MTDVGGLAIDPSPKRRTGAAEAPPIDLPCADPYMRALFCSPLETERAMKVRSSLKSLKTRHRDCKLVRRKGRVYIINKTQRRFKARQG